MVMKFKRLHPLAVIPSRAHGTDSGLDVHSSVAHLLLPGERKMIGTGLAAVIPAGYEIQVRPRSSLSRKGIDAAFGTVDNGYRGEIGIVLVNNTKFSFEIAAGDRIAQLVLAPVALDYAVEETDILDETERGVGGFGSTGR